MDYILVFVEITLLSGLITAQITWTSLYTHMFDSVVSSKMTLWSCLLVTFPAWVFLSFMYCSLVFSKITLWSCLVVTFPTALWCSVRWPIEVARWSHSLHWYFFPPGGLWDHLYLMFNDHIWHRYTLYIVNWSQENMFTLSLLVFNWRRYRR